MKELPGYPLDRRFLFQRRVEASATNPGINDRLMAQSQKQNRGV